MSRFRQSKFLVSGAMLTWVSLFAVSSASAAPLECVQRAIDWTLGSDYYTINGVNYALSALHESGEGAYATGAVERSTCNTVNPPGGVSFSRTYSCLVNGGANKALLLHPSGYPSGKTTTAPDLLALFVGSIPNDDWYKATLRQPNATYDFVPACVGNELIGHDQWGNQWTVSFSLTQRANLH